MTRPVPQSGESVEDYLRAMPARRLAILEPLQRDEQIVGALNKLKGAHDTWDAFEEVELRLAALTIVDRTVAGFENFLTQAPRGEGARVEKASENERAVRHSLALVRAVLLTVREVAVEDRALQPSGVRLDPESNGGAQVNTGARGRPASILTGLARDLLLRRFPEWDGKQVLKARNTAELRAWLSVELRGNPANPSPFNEEALDPTSRGVLWRIVSNFQRLQ